MGERNASAASLVERLDRLLPQTQCGQCGYAGCRPYAEAMAAGSAGVERCPPGGDEGARALAKLLGLPPRPYDRDLGEHRGREVEAGLRCHDGAVDAALAYRLPDPEDGRKVVVHLSELGRTRLSRLEALVSAHEAALAASLGADRVAALVRALGDLACLEG